jgi:hypothetical protein
VSRKYSIEEGCRRMSNTEWVNFALQSVKKRVVQRLERMYKETHVSRKQGQIHAESRMEETKWISKRLNSFSGNVTVFFAFS